MESTTKAKGAYDNLSNPLEEKKNKHLKGSAL
jgi:hypothetical protein